MSDPVYLLHLTMGTIIGAIGVACAVSLRREQQADTARLLDGLDQAVIAHNEFVEFHAQQHHELVSTLVRGLEGTIRANSNSMQAAVALHATHTDDTLERVGKTILEEIAAQTPVELSMEGPTGQDDIPALQIRTRTEARVWREEKKGMSTGPLYCCVCCGKVIFPSEGVRTRSESGMPAYRCRACWLAMVPIPGGVS